MRKIIITVSSVLLVVIAAVWLIARDGSGSSGQIAGDGAGASDSSSGSAARSSAIPSVSDGGEITAESQSVEAGDGGANADEAEDPEDAREAAEEALVDAFDARVDSWMEPTGTVTTAEVDAFLAAFSRVPKDRREECLQRALNLIPDENVMLLVGVLLDKRQDKELVELVFNDLLNRDEEVKTPILKLIYADRTHPCWKDAAWVLDADDDQDEGGAKR